MAIAWIVLFLLATGCSKVNNSLEGAIGENLTKTSSLYNASGIQSESLYLLDRPTNRLLQINLPTLTIKSAQNLAHPEEEHTIAASDSGSYVLVFSPKRLEIIRPDDSREEFPYAFQGKPVSAAFDSAKGILVMRDDLQSILILMLSDRGKILKSWLSGSVIDKDKVIVSGDIDRKGQLVLGINDKSIAIIDIAASIDANAWKMSTFDTGIDGISWIAPDNEKDQLFLVAGTDTIAIVNSETKTVLEQVSLVEKRMKVIGQSKRVKPHILISNSGTGRLGIYYIDQNGKLAFRDLVQPFISESKFSILNVSGTELTALFSLDETHRVIRLRLADYLVTLNASVQSDGEANVGPDILLINKHSKLGYLESHRLSDMKKQELKGYNFDFLRNK